MLSQSRKINLVGTSLFCLVDAEDFERVSEFKWYLVQPPTCKTPYAHRVIWVPGKGREGNYTLRMHRFVLGLSKGDGKIVDHINGNGLDNRRSNLRLCTRAENSAHSIREARVGLKGVYLDKRRGKWRAQITVDRKYVHLGMADNPEYAFELYKEAARKYFREFATFEKKIDTLQKQK